MGKAPDGSKRSFILLSRGVSNASARGLRLFFVFVMRRSLDLRLFGSDGRRIRDRHGLRADAEMPILQLRDEIIRQPRCRRIETLLARVGGHGRLGRIAEPSVERPRVTPETRQLSLRLTSPRLRLIEE